MSDENQRIFAQVDDLLNRPKQMWLFGAGISKNAGVPLMRPLTERISELLIPDEREDFEHVREQLSEHAHVEHVLTHLGNLIEIAETRRDHDAPFGDEARSLNELRALHRSIQHKLREVIRWGYVPAQNGAVERVGTADAPIISVENHRRFIQALFSVRRAGLERRPPVAVFTTNYDTLIEDALALSKISAYDGFSGGSMGFWNPSVEPFSFGDPLKSSGLIRAKLYKLHGSIDWYSTPEEIVVRRRDGAQYPPEDRSRLLVYPQATKYLTTQREPFSQLFGAFRRGLLSGSEAILAICGYGFGDLHINQELEWSLENPASQLTVVAFVQECHDGADNAPGDGNGPCLPSPLEGWLAADRPWSNRLIVVTDRGVYHGTRENQVALNEDEELDLWTFEGLTSFLTHGPEILEV